MSVQRSSLSQKLLSTSSNLFKKELHSSHLKDVFQKLWNKAIKKAVSAFRSFLKNVYDEVYFWKNYRLLLPALPQISSIVAISREFSKSFETIKNVSSLWDVSAGVISGKIAGGCPVFSFKLKEFYSCRFRSSHLTCSMKKGFLRNIAQFTGKHARVSFSIRWQQVDYN